MTGKTRFAIVFMLVVSLTLPQIVAAQEFDTPGSDWRVVLAVKPKTKVVITLWNRTEVQGKLRSVSDTMIVLSNGRKTSEVARQDIASIYRLEKSMRDSASKGASFGIRPAAAVFRKIDKGGNVGLIIIPIVGIAVASIGVPFALGGLFVGVIHHKRVLVYEVFQKSSTPAS